FGTRRLSLSDQVHQTPADMFSQPGKEAKINCFHTIPNYNQILWYKQTKRQLQFLGYMYASANPEDGAGVKIEGSAKKDENCTLTIEGLTLSLYFCAVSEHSDTDT
uniref:Immunoglobulin V-set domain-containing protein n=1 Tax=Sparus aurata TaxID=8175 RepID=A0A671XFF6_SPAAU